MVGEMLGLESAWFFRFHVIAQIHAAGTTCRSVSRQLRSSSTTPSKTTATVPAAYASGVSQRRRPPSSRSAVSTLAGSVLRTAAAACMSARHRDRRRTGRMGGLVTIVAAVGRGSIPTVSPPGPDSALVVSASKLAPAAMEVRKQLARFAGDPAQV